MALGTPGSPGCRGQLQVNTVMVIVFIKAMQVVRILSAVGLGRSALVDPSPPSHGRGVTEHGDMPVSALRAVDDLRQLNQFYFDEVCASHKIQWRGPGYSVR